MELTEFLTARLDEDEAVARSVWPIKRTGYRGDVPDKIVVSRLRERSTDGSPYADSDPELTDFLAHCTPARVLADVEAKRRIVAAYEDALSVAQVKDDAMGNDADDWSPSTALRDALRSLASVYVDHADYDPAWAD